MIIPSSDFDFARYQSGEYGDHCIIHGDCREILPKIPDKAIDLVLTDPPYGIGWVPRINNRLAMIGDDEPFDPSLFLEIGNNHLFWGANYFSSRLPDSESWFLWLKQPDTFDNCKKTYSPCEMAWSDFGGKPRIKHHTWDGNFRSGIENPKFIHPAQKPIEIMRWCLSSAPNNPSLILDPFLGSGTTLVAAKNLGRRAIGIEINYEYCVIAENRLRQEVLAL